MNNLLKIIFLLFICVIGYSASADQYISSTPHGNIITDATLTPGSSPYVFAPNASFFALGQIVSYSTVSETVNLTIQNNTGSVITLIPTQTIGAMGATYTYTHGDVTPSTPGSYAMKFVTGVDVPPQPQVPTITGVSIYSVCYNNNDCDIQGDASLDIPARAGDESIDVSYKYKLCSTGGGCNPNVDESQTEFGIGAGQTDVHAGIMGTPNAEPQIYGYCVTSSTAIIPQNLRCQ